MNLRICKWLSQLYNLNGSVFKRFRLDFMLIQVYIGRGINLKVV